MTAIYGLLERITYYNEENDFLVAKLQEKGKKELTTIVGNLSGINPGESLKLSGRWVHNKKFGEQFQVETFEVTVPATVHGMGASRSPQNRGYLARCNFFKIIGKCLDLIFRP